ncbi:hypothetical protein SAMN05444169_4206 [Bradyrhizobium erythrophlei]|uniref:Uncharacterized protein n=1 Tax=Bradyrhizobium erythrophlei TaxID=1437360 RepID=A0A1M5MRS1_9BRAD|nr:hypothetical protein SAMN05444169_4206 [Bradyrhizobium erythrophlei]
MEGQRTFRRGAVAAAQWLNLYSVGNNLFAVTSRLVTRWNCRRWGAHVSLNETGSARAADSAAKMVGLAARVGADPDLAERTCTTDAEQEGNQARIMSRPICLWFRKPTTLGTGISWVPNLNCGLFRHA